MLWIGGLDVLRDSLMDVIIAQLVVLVCVSKYFLRRLSEYRLACGLIIWY